MPILSIHYIAQIFGNFKSKEYSWTNPYCPPNQQDLSSFMSQVPSVVVPTVTDRRLSWLQGNWPS